MAKLIVPNQGDKVVLMTIGKLKLKTTITFVDSFNAEANTWAVTVLSGRDPFCFCNDEGYSPEILTVHVHTKVYASHDWELADGNN